jgi:hypothetical protein
MFQRCPFPLSPLTLSHLFLFRLSPLCRFILLFTRFYSPRSPRNAVVAGAALSRSILRSVNSARFFPQVMRHPIQILINAEFQVRAPAHPAVPTYPGGVGV